MIELTFDTNITIKETIVEEINLIEKYKYFPEVNAVGQLNKRKQRRINVANLDDKKVILYHFGQYKYTDPYTGKTKYITEKLPNVSGKMRHDLSTVVKSVLPVLKNEMTIKYAASQARQLLNLTVVPSTIWFWIDKIDINEHSYQAMESRVIEKSSGHASVDEVYDNGDSIIFITDPVSNTILSGSLTEGKPDNDNILQELTALKGKGFDLKTCTRDGSPLYINTIKSVFPLVLLQICIFHLIKNCLKYFLNWHRRLRQELKTSSLPRGQKGNGKSLKKFLFKNRCLFVKKELTHKEKERMEKIIEAYPSFGKLRMLYLRFMAIFDSQSFVEAEKRLWDFLAEPIIGKELAGLQKQLLKYHTKNELFTYLLYDKEIWTKIRTSNHTERINRKFRKKQKTHYRIRKTMRRKKMIRFMIYFQNMSVLGFDILLLILFFCFAWMFQNITKNIIVFRILCEKNYRSAIMNFSRIL
jgi:hypothetical protein